MPHSQTPPNTDDGRTEVYLPPIERLRAGQRWIFLALILILGTLIYLPVRHFEFLNFDDGAYISDNPWLQRGLTWHGIEWAFLANLTEFSQQAEYWGPLTLLSRLLDVQFYGMNSGAFHVTSALIHFLNAALLGFALFRLTGRWERSVAVALLFLVHPLNIQPIGWLSARKDVLSGTFFFCTLLAYGHFVRKPDLPRYLLLLVAFCCALMAKPMGVTIPFVLMILDWWPLHRWQKAAGKPAEYLKLIGEKLPLLMLAVAASVLAVASQSDVGALGSLETYPLSVRVNNALVSYVIYLRRVFWPSDLAILYPHPGNSLPFWEGGLAAVFLLGCTFVALKLVRRAPFVLAGWLWFGLVLGPVIGLVQIGYQGMADRYAYPSILGIFIVVVWGVAEGLADRKRLRTFLAGGALALLTACSMRQVLYYRNSITLFSHAVEVTKDNAYAYFNLGTALHESGKMSEARQCFLECIHIMPMAAGAWVNLGNVERDLGNQKGAYEDYRWSMKLNPKFAPAALAMGRNLYLDGELDEAAVYLTKAVQLDPKLEEPYRLLGVLFFEQKRWGLAEHVWSALLKVHPDNVLAREGLRAARAGQAEPK
jgi:tetratricopeptide (TPR) repeat protein